MQPAVERHVLAVAAKERHGCVRVTVVQSRHQKSVGTVDDSVIAVLRRLRSDVGYVCPIGHNAGSLTAEQLCIFQQILHNIFLSD